MVQARAPTRRLLHGHCQRLASIPGDAQTRFVVDHHPHVGHPQTRRRGVDNGLIAPELAVGIARVKSVKSVGMRTGNWLSVRQAKLINAPDVATMRGLRDRAILAVLLGCGLRRSEVIICSMREAVKIPRHW